MTHLYLEIQPNIYYDGSFLFITGCLKPTNVEELLSGMGPPAPAIRAGVCARLERHKQSPERHTLRLVRFQLPNAGSLDTVSCQVYDPQTCQQKSLDECSECRKRLCNKPHIRIINLHEEMAKGCDSPWTTWKCMNRLRTWYTCSKAQRKKWKFFTGDTTCACERVEKSRHTWYSVPNLHILAPWMTSLCSMM